MVDEDLLSKYLKRVSHFQAKKIPGNCQGYILNQEKSIQICDARLK